MYAMYLEQCLACKEYQQYNIALMLVVQKTGAKKEVLGSQK